MDVSTVAVDLPFAATTPVSVSKVGLKARDAEALARYYSDIVGLREIGRGDGTIRMGAGDRVLLEIEEAPGALPDDPREAGLFHTAFLLPGRADLARWLHRAMDRRIRIDGASDHLVSEAVYLSDPEGNGIEIYADRPRGEWPFEGKRVKMATIPLDVRSLLSILPDDDAGWRGAPDGAVVGHVHLRVGDPAEAERWWHDEMGFDTMAEYGRDAVFLATGGYHHHIGANAWSSRGAGRRNPARAGLGFVELVSHGASVSATRHDPWGTEIGIVPARG